VVAVHLFAGLCLWWIACVIRRRWMVVEQYTYEKRERILVQQGIRCAG
jgi:hypothetical protein